MRSEEPRTIGKKDGERGERERIEIGEWQSREVHDAPPLLLPARARNERWRDPSNSNCVEEGEGKTKTRTKRCSDRPTDRIGME